MRPSPKLRSWPARRDGYTVVLSVVPSTAGPDVARTRALAAVAAGAPDVGVLASSRYSSLHPGYWLVFSGVYRTLDEALAALPRAARHARSRLRATDRALTVRAGLCDIPEQDFVTAPKTR